MGQLLIQKNERVDDLQNGFSLIQDPQTFCFGMDAVLLSAFARIKPKEKVLDLGCGNGILPLLLYGRYREGIFTGLEIQEGLAGLAKRNVTYNGLEDRISICQGDIREAAQLFGAASFSVVVSNPPYLAALGGLKNKGELKKIARHEVCCTFSDVAKAASYTLKSAGRFYLVHRPFRLPEIMYVLKEHHLEPKRMRLVYPYLDREPNMVLIEARKGARPELKLEPPLIVYEKEGVYTEEIVSIYNSAV